MFPPGFSMFFPCSPMEFSETEEGDSMTSSAAAAAARATAAWRLFQGEARYGAFDVWVTQKPMD